MFKKLLGLRRHVVFLNQARYEYEEDGRGIDWITYSDIDAGTAHGPPSLFKDDPARFVELKALRSNIEDVLKTLSPVEEEIIRRRFGLRPGDSYARGQTHKEISKHVRTQTGKVSRQRIEQIEKKAFKKLRHPLRRKKLKHFID